MQSNWEVTVKEKEKTDWNPEILTCWMMLFSSILLPIEKEKKKKKRHIEVIPKILARTAAASDPVQGSINAIQSHPKGFFGP